MAFEIFESKESTQLQELIEEGTVAKSFEGDESMRKGKSRRNTQLYATRWWINDMDV